MSKLKANGEWIKAKGVLFGVLCAVFFIACNPDAQYATKDVEITITPTTVSAGFVECSFSTNTEAYYLIDCVPAQDNFNPLDPENQKPFMLLALDSANVRYLEWRHYLLNEGEFNIAPFASHCLQYGDLDHFFTNLKPGADYWIYAFAVDPEKLQPAGKLYLQKVTTSKTGVVDVRFDYFVRGYWDYIYPINNDPKREKYGEINYHYPYFAATIDSAYMTDVLQQTEVEYFNDLFRFYARTNYSEFIRFGVQVTYNDGFSSDEMFVPGTTYFTAIAGFDGAIDDYVIYKFTWSGEDFEKWFRNENRAVSNGENN